MRPCTRAVIVAAMAAFPGVIHAQRTKEPKRPRLEAGADTNDAHAYYDFAVASLKRDPEKAADALYWATRLEPTWADAYYARRIALLLSEPRRLSRYWSGDRRTIQSKEIKQIDSLFYYALTLNPFVSQRLDRLLFESVVDQFAREYSNAGGLASDARYAVDREIASWPAADRAWLAYGEGRTDEALRLYAEAIHSDKKNGPLRVDRARIFYNRGDVDSALVELTAAIEDLRKRDKKDLIYVYQSKALAEHSLAVVQQALGHTDAAKEAFGRALQEDLSYFPAHLQLGFMALGAKDTTTALSEMDLATQLRGDDAVARYVYGFTLASAGKAAEAEPQLRKAIELDPVFAAPHFILGQVLEQTKRTADAVTQYTIFLAGSAKNDLRREQAQARVAALGAGSGELTR